MRLRNIKKIPLEIASLIGSNKKICSLIYNDDSNALENNSEVTFSDLIKEGYINLFFPTENGIKNIAKNTFLSIGIEDIYVESLSVTGVIYVVSNENTITLDGNKNRLLELVDEIESSINGQKISVTGEIRVLSISSVVFSDFRSGYRISFKCFDQQNRKAEL